MSRSQSGCGYRAAALLAAVLATGCRPEGAVRDRVVVAYASGPSALAPDRVNDELTISILSNVYETLVDFDRKHALVPGLAESWYSEDDRTWVLRLREGIRLHDGRTLEARHVVAAIDWARTAPESKRRGELSPLVSVTAQDARTLVVRTSEPFASLPLRLTAVAIWAAAARPEEPPVGTGPYRVVQAAVSGDVILEAFAGYRGGPPDVRRLEFRAIPGVPDRIAQLSAGTVHVLPDVPPDTMSALADVTSVRTIAEGGLRVVYLIMDVTRPESPFRDVRVRRAVLLALDREALVRGPLRGFGEPIDQLVAPPVFGFHASLPSPPPPDPEAARRFLAEAGLPSGFDVDLDYAPKRYPALEALAAAIGRDLAAIGVRVRPRPAEPADLLDRIGRREVTLCLTTWTSIGGDAGMSYNYLLRTMRDGFGTQNAGGWSDAEVDRLLQAQSRELDPERRRSLIGRVAERVLEDLPVIPLQRQMDLYAVAKDLDFRPRADRRIRGAELKWRPSAAP